MDAPGEPVYGCTRRASHVVDEHGSRVAVILCRSTNNARIDLHDIAAVAERCEEPANRVRSSSRNGTSSNDRIRKFHVRASVEKDIAALPRIRVLLSR